MGEDLWKHGFARTAATLTRDGDDHDLDDVVRQVWVDAGRPAPDTGHGLAGAEASVAVRHRWDSELDAAHAWARTEDPTSYQQWQHWHTGGDSTGSAPRRRRRAARRRPAHRAGHAAGPPAPPSAAKPPPPQPGSPNQPCLPNGGATPPGQPAHPQPPVAEQSESDTQAAESTPDLAQLQRPQPTRSLRRTPARSRPRPSPRQKGLGPRRKPPTPASSRTAPTNSVSPTPSRKLDFGKARSPAALAIWRMRDTAVAHGLHKPPTDDAPQQQNALEKPNQQGDNDGPGSRTRAGWDSPQRRDRLQRRLESTTGGDGDSVQARLDADLTQATPPDESITQQPRPTRIRGRGAGGPVRGHDRSRGH